MIDDKGRFVIKYNPKIGEKINLLTINYIFYKDKDRYVNCTCECGNVVNKTLISVCKNMTKSCGCLKESLIRELRRTHNMSNTPEYCIWENMCKRCNNKKYHRYAGRGIKVCERWKSFVNFYEDMGPKPDKDYSIERQDVNGDYCKDNCIWLPRKKQSYNREITIKITWDGETKRLQEWADIVGVHYYTLFKRYVAGITPPDLFLSTSEYRKRDKKQ